VVLLETGAAAPFKYSVSKITAQPNHMRGKLLHSWIMPVANYYTAAVVLVDYYTSSTETQACGNVRRRD